MSTVFDFSPLFRSSLGAGQLLDAFEASNRASLSGDWPPHDIVRMGDDDYRVIMAVAGYSSDDLTITQEHDELVVAGKRPVSKEDNGYYLHRGIDRRDFQYRFRLAEHVKVTGASIVNGLLSVDLMRELPEEMKPRRISITSGAEQPQAETRQIGTAKIAA
ncbi:MAG TPA: molecular chaperone Hsp20 [Alphaproteobacteria bacterium]|jgi:molecular chaperone IbpA|nr:molecular chaperone Hsp20 [Alphaproteobacteria bacterium]